MGIRLWLVLAQQMQQVRPFRTTVSRDYTPLLVWAGVFVVLMLLAFWLWMLVDCLTRDFSGSDKVVWVIVIIFLNLLGALLYCVIARRQARRDV